MPELEAPGHRVDVDEVDDLGWSQGLQRVGARLVEAGLVAARVGEDAEVTGAVKGSKQQQIAGLGGEVT